MKSFLPVDWLVPTPLGDYAIASFCVLDIRNITVSPLPLIAGLNSISCAPHPLIDASITTVDDKVKISILDDQGSDIFIAELAHSEKNESSLFDFESAYYTSGGTYEWSYHGLTEKLL